MALTSDDIELSEQVQLYERLGEPLNVPVGIRALDLGGLAPGDHIIDVATSTGALAIAAAERGARVMAIDIVPAMVSRAAERLQRFDGCEARVMDLEALDTPEAYFDAAYSIMGVVAFSSWRKGLSELVRVTRPGGCIAVAMWNENTDATAAHLLKRVFEACFPGREMWPKNFFPAWTTDSLAGALRKAGCGGIEVEVFNAEWTPPPSSSGLPTTAAKLLEICDPMFRNFPGYASVTAAERERLSAAFAKAVAPYARPDGTLRMPTEAFIAVARKSA